MNLRILLVVILFFGACKVSLADDTFVVWHEVQRLSYETVTLPGDEHMGLAGLHYLVGVSSRLYAGVGVFSAVSGSRGGFFTGGIEGGIRQPVAGPLSVDAGLFVGGGGGRYTFQGGGLMVRPHVGLLYGTGDVQFGLAYALVDFPNGDIRSGHALVSIELPFDVLRIAPDHTEDLSAILDQASDAVHRPIIFRQEHLAVRLTAYSPPAGILNLDGRKTGAIQLTGIEYGREFTEKTYLFLEASGAAGGHADGYAEFFFGSGYRIPVYGRHVFLDSRIAVGASGGGGVDTGGGRSGKVSLGLSFKLGDTLSLDTRAGYETTDGAFHARTTELGLRYDLDTASFGWSSAPRGPLADQLRVNSWRTRLTYQQYLSRKASMRKNGTIRTVSLLGGKIDKFLDEGPFYLTGQAQSAVAGGAGGFSLGLIGIGYLSGPLAGTGFHIFVEAAGGASGGGGIDVGGGAVIEPQAGILFDISSSTGIEASIGRIKALTGGLDSTVGGLSFVYRFSTVGRNMFTRGELMNQ